MKTTRLRPRPYQVEAYKWALSRKKATICMPTGTGKTLIAGLWIREVLRRTRGKAIVLEPTRFLVEQTARFLREKLGLDAAPLHGSLPRSMRQTGLRARVLVATPEIIVSMHREGVFQGGDISALVVDECHHTTGKDAYVEAVRILDEALYRLGLSALIPPSRASLIREWIGPIRCWDWSHPGIRPYIPQWIGEVYEAPFNEAEERLYRELEVQWDEASGTARMILGMALRWLARDGAAALRESYDNSPRLRSLLKPLEGLLKHPGVRDEHKMPSAMRILVDHEPFEKALVFVDRVVIARDIAGFLESRGYRTALLLGRRRLPREALSQARDPDTRVVVATSAGEEGIDLPEAGLLVIWSNTASPLRFVQRLGRLLRPRRGTRVPKAAVFLVTPDTVDVDSLLDGVIAVRASGVEVNVGEESVRYLMELSRKRRILELIEEKPLPEDVIASALGIPLTRLKPHLRWLRENGLAGYIYTPLGRLYFPLGKPQLLDAPELAEYTNPPKGVVQELTVSCKRHGDTITVRRRSSHHDETVSLLEKKGPCKSLRVTVLTWQEGRVVMSNIAYDYLVGSREVLRRVLGNALWKALWDASRPTEGS